MNLPGFCLSRPSDLAFTPSLLLPSFSMSRDRMDRSASDAPTNIHCSGAENRADTGEPSSRREEKCRRGVSHPCPETLILLYWNRFSLTHLRARTGVFMASVLRPALLLFLCGAAGASQRPQWPVQRVPVVWPQQTEERPPPHFLQPAQLELTSSCGPDCHKQAPAPSYWDLRHFLSYETLHSSGQLTETAVGIYRFDANSFYKTPALRSRSKRQIFGHDSRFSIVGQDFLLNYPFSTAVKLSTGCSGTLVGDRHVLTAAHCVHDGKNYVKGAQRLRVGFLKPQQKDSSGRNGTGPDKMKFQWIRVKRTHVPKGWIKGTANDIGMDYDYALLELKKAHKRRHMKLGISPSATQLPGKRVQFSGFDNDRPGQLVYRFCEAGDETYDLLYQRCDAQPGASGSGVYARMWSRRRRRWERKVIGIFSGHQWVDLSGTPQEFNVAVRITPLKFAQICYWIKGNYVDCREG
ncbi:serine protease 23-like isoform X1 [Chanodichthys erythropterus]|uniref:serine protease 23-like isoform X1 n=1 Tax=Chanodichthys erythropterus TaxID=933992 RepID=UPI00351F3D4D